MSSKLYKVFEEVELQATVLSNYWHNFYSEISQYLPESYQPEMQELSAKLGEALENLIAELHKPTLTLATTGTTSSGKSTLVNLLCGAEIVPVAVSEMSAGVVTIEYSEEKSLVIHETPGAEWECGEWRGIHEDEICQRLHDVMISYIDNREKYPDLACPQSVIGFPFRLLKESNLQLPRGTRVRIMDLPGLAYVGDEGNASVIRQCREALCIVAYNSQETDQQKVRNLLQEVVEQVKDLGGSPARMLFVLNKIDVFRADRSWPDSENRFVNNTIKSIKTELLERLKEYTDDIEKLQVVKLSTWPALLSLQIQSTDEDFSTKACKSADNNFNGLIAADILDDLPRRVQNWSRHDRNRVARELWQKSYAEEFQQNLRSHITKHFPQLVIPQMIDRFNILGGNAIAEWTTQTVTAILSSSEKDYEKECQNIVQIRMHLENFLRKSDLKLREPFEKVDAEIKQALAGELEKDPIFYLEATIVKLTNTDPYNALGLEKLFPLFGWRRELAQGIKQVLEAVAKSLESGKVDLEGTNLKKANRRNVSLLENSLRRLVDLDYTSSVAQKGKSSKAKSDEEKYALKRLNEELNELAIHLSLVMENVLQQIFKQDLNRMHEAVVELFNFHLLHLEKGVYEIAPNMAIKFPESQLIKVDRQPEIDFKFKAGFPITKGTWQEARETTITIEESHQRNTRGKSGWDWVTGAVKGLVVDYYLKGQIRKEKYIDYIQRSSDDAEIPKVRDLLEGWIEQSKMVEVKIVNQIASWLLEQIDYLKKNVDKVQAEVVDRYQIRLDKAHKEITLDFEKQRDIWEPLQEKARSLSQEFSALGNDLNKEY